MNIEPIAQIIGNKLYIGYTVDGSEADVQTEFDLTELINNFIDSRVDDMGVVSDADYISDVEDLMDCLDEACIDMAGALPQDEE